jgi:hypothetical protein
MEVRYSDNWWDERNACKVLIITSQKKRLCDRFRHGYGYNINMNFRETGCECVNWI